MVALELAIALAGSCENVKTRFETLGSEANCQRRIVSAVIKEKRKTISSTAPRLRPPQTVTLGSLGFAFIFIMKNYHGLLMEMKISN